LKWCTAPRRHGDKRMQVSRPGHGAAASPGAGQRHGSLRASPPLADHAVPPGAATQRNLLCRAAAGADLIPRIENLPSRRTGLFRLSGSPRPDGPLFRQRAGSDLAYLMCLPLWNPVLVKTVHLAPARRSTRRDARKLPVANQHRLLAERPLGLGQTNGRSPPRRRPSGSPRRVNTVRWHLADGTAQPLPRLAFLCPRFTKPAAPEGRGFKRRPPAAG
jgi:hypothetical protein